MITTIILTVVVIIVVIMIIVVVGAKLPERGRGLGPADLRTRESRPKREDVARLSIKHVASEILNRRTYICFEV